MNSMMKTRKDRDVPTGITLRKPPNIQTGVADNCLQGLKKGSLEVVSWTQM